MSEQTGKTEKVICVDGLCKTFGEGDEAVTALQGIDLKVDKGDFIAVMGPSGSGKSTLLHLLAGLATPDAGRIVIGGEEIGTMPDNDLTVFRRRNIGLVFQAYNLIPSLSMIDNVMLPVLADRNRELPADRLENVFEELGIRELKERKPDSMSGGEQQRAAIARALVMDPRVILADEPTGNVDTENSRKICTMLRKLCDEEGRTIMMVTHEPAVAVWARKIITIRDGRITGTLDTAGLKDARDLTLRYYDMLNPAGSEGA